MVKESKKDKEIKEVQKLLDNAVAIRDDLVGRQKALEKLDKDKVDYSEANDLDFNVDLYNEDVEMYKVALAKLKGKKFKE